MKVAVWLVLIISAITFADGYDRFLNKENGSYYVWTELAAARLNSQVSSGINNGTITISTNSTRQKTVQEFALEYYASSNGNFILLPLSDSDFTNRNCRVNGTTLDDVFNASDAFGNIPTNKWIDIDEFRQLISSGEYIKAE